MNFDNAFTTRELVIYTRDYHKEAFGYRCDIAGGMSDDDTRKACLLQIENIDKFLNKMAETDKGRTMLKMENWIV